MRISFIMLLVIINLVVSPEVEAKLRVVTTLPDFASIAGELGGDRVTADSLIRGTQDPHFVDARPSLILGLSRADLLIRIGMELEDGWLPVLLNQSRNGALTMGKTGYLDASNLIEPMGRVANPDRSMGDVHSQGNPHYYTSPRELFAVAEEIYNRLTILDPDGFDYYSQRWAEFSKKYQLKTKEWQNKVQSLKGTNVIVYDESWIYLVDWIGFKQAGALEPVPGVPPSPAHIAGLLNGVKTKDIKFVFQEIYHPNNLSRIFAKKAGARLLVLPSMVGAEPGIKSIWDKFDRIVELLTATN